MRTFVIGAGNWGTVLAIEISAVMPVLLWTTTDEHADAINSQQENTKYLPGYKLPDKLKAEKIFTSIIEPDDIVMISVPSSQVEKVCRSLCSKINNSQIIISVSKGVVSDSLKTVSEAIESVLPQARVSVITGPTIAREIAANQPSKAILASHHLDVLLKLEKVLKLPHLKFEFSSDVRGVEICAALKGILAIGVGIAEGLGLESNIQGIIMTYGLKEFKTIAKFLQIQENTIYGLAGMGDLITTCISADSRNRRFGRLLANGVTLQDALFEVGMVVEGVAMAKNIVELSHFNLYIPLFKCITRIIFENPVDIYSELVGTINGIN